MNQGFISKITLTNRQPRPVGFKFKTNAPARYSVKPVVGMLDANGSVDVFVRSETTIHPGDRFLLQNMALTKDEAANLTPAS
ncbi:hypothetical protein HK104_000304, partial [Borealophlyctis nickersoniae]